MLERINTMSPAELAKREAIAVQLATTHFSYAGTVEQIGMFMLGNGSDLQCEPLPSDWSGSQL